MDILLINNGVKFWVLFILVFDCVIFIWKLIWYNYFVVLSMLGFFFNEIGKYIYKYVYFV